MFSLGNQQPSGFGAMFWCSEGDRAEHRPASLYELRAASGVFRRGDATIAAVDSVDLAIPAGGFVALEGPSGYREDDAAAAARRARPVDEWARLLTTDATSARFATTISPSLAAAGVRLRLPRAQRQRTEPSPHRRSPPGLRVSRRHRMDAPTSSSSDSERRLSSSRSRDQVELLLRRAPVRLDVLEGGQRLRIRRRAGYLLRQRQPGLLERLRGSRRLMPRPAAPRSRLARSRRARAARARSSERAIPRVRTA
jgi:hypothetical protein